MSEELICVRRTATVEEADIVVAWLAKRGIQASVLDRDSTGVIAFGVTDEEGIEIVVRGQDAADKAVKLLTEHDEQRHRQQEQAAGIGDVTVRCEECDFETTFSANLRGTVQTCDHCGAHVDVPQG